MIGKTFYCIVLILVVFSTGCNEKMSTVSSSELNDQKIEVKVHVDGSGLEDGDHRSGFEFGERAKGLVGIPRLDQ